MNFEYDSMHPNRQSSSRPTRPMWTEAQAREDLAIDQYPAKWAIATQHCTDRCYYTHQYAGYSYWERVHCMFFELGGCRISELPPYPRRTRPSVAPTPTPVLMVNAVVVGEVTSVEITPADPKAFGGSDELKAHLRQIWSAQLARDLQRVGL